MRRTLSTILLFLSVFPAVAAAQPAPAPRSNPAGQPPPLPSASASAAPSSTTSLPPPPSVDDPMLAPVPPATQVISRWNEAISIVRSRSTDLKIAYLEVLRAEAQSRVALAGALTTINANGTYTHQLITDTTNQTVPVTDANGNIVGQTQVPITTPTPDIGVASISLIQPIVNLRTWHAIKTAHMNEQVLSVTFEEEERQITLGVAKALVGVVTTERVAEINRVSLRRTLETLDLTKKKQGLGVATGLDIVRAQQDVETARATLVSGDENLRQAREALGLALGIPTAIGVTRDLNLDGLITDARNACQPAKNTEERTDVVLARERIDLAQRGVDDVKLQFAPTLNLQSALSTTTIAPNQGSPRNSWSIQGVLTIPIWEGGARYGNLHDNEHQVEEAQQRLEATRRSVTIEIVQDQRAVTVGEESRRVAERARDLALEQDRLVQRSYIEGIGTSLDLVTSAAALRQAELNLALQEFNLVQAKIVLVLAMSNCKY